ncbi:hypothetical protein HPB50_001999 [Hyalomma asiaticum]|uniref:Uncharacterized protein n=1 Tax=Hyalomma asiaticum TaxID=266040 RepID=A0ACB7S118_HYAAI|nr:hypothetical protein HPB50_001999 [Hyalomma asiaticum]
MAYCCVPHCRSDGKQRLPGVSFHEIPAEETARQQWIKAIRRDDWVPNTTSNYSRVCSKHFRETDFAEGKRHRLKKGVILTVLSDYPSYLRPQPLKERTTERIQKRSASQCEDKENEPKRKRNRHREDTHGEASTSNGIDLELQTSKYTNETSLDGQQQTMHSETILDEATSCAHKTIADQATQLDVALSNLLAVERAKWKRKERDLKNQVERFRQTADQYKEELKKLKDDCHFADLEYICEQAKEKDLPAVFLLNQITNFRRKKPTSTEDVVRHCVILRHLSTKAYEHARKERLLKLPCRNTLQNYIGSSFGETGVNDLIQGRLKAELDKLEAPQSKICTLIVDEMCIKPKLQYNKQQDCFVGHVDMGVANEPESEAVLANSLLCFVINGLSTSYRIPVSYFFTKGLNGFQLSKLIRDPIESLFGTLRRSLGCNDQLDARSAVSGLQKLLKTGIAAASENSNVLRSEEAGQNNGVVVARQQTPKISTKLPAEAVHVLERLKRTNVPASLPTLQLSAVVCVGGYIACVVMEHMDCDDCCAVTIKALSNQPLQQFVWHQDRGGLLYPSDKLLCVLETLRQFVETALQQEPRLQKPLKTILEAAVPSRVKFSAAEVHYV